MRIVFSIVLFFVFSLSYGQKEANIWYFGQNAGLDFNTTPPTAITDGQLDTLEGCSSFSDANGDILFYSDGTTVWDKNHNVMNYTNGQPANDLKGNPSSTQSGMIIPKPGSTSIYYLFTVGDSSNPAYNLYTIDMSLNGNSGELIDENNDGVFFKDLITRPSDIANWTEKVAAVKGSECNTYWVVSLSGDTFYSYKITSTGVSGLSIKSTVDRFASNTRGYLKLSPDGTKLAVAHQNSAPQCLLYSFNSTTGVVSNDAVSLFNGFAEGQAYGLEFSRSSKKLYISSTSGFRPDPSAPETTYKVFQYDLSAIDIATTQTLIHEQVGFRGALQLGPDGKIYSTVPIAYVNGEVSHLNIIENPEAEASKVIYTQNAIDLNGKMSTQGLPPFISSLLLPVEIKDNDTNKVINNEDLKFCVGQTKTIIPETLTGTNIVYKWVFINTSNVETTISTNANLVLTNLTSSNDGEYKLYIELDDSCGNNVKLEGEFKIEVFEQAEATKPTDINFCDADADGFSTFDFESDVTPQVLNGLDPTTFEVSYFLSLKDAQENNTANKLPLNYTNTIAFTNETIHVRVHNKKAPNSCYKLTNFNLHITDKPIAQNLSNYYLCDDISSGDDTDGFTNDFLLNSKDNEILGTLDPNLYNVSYHTTLIDAQTSSNSNPIDKNIAYKNTTVNSQTIYVRLENNVNSDCFESSKSFDLVVTPLPIISSKVTLKQCDNDTDGFSLFNLNEANSKISTNFINESFTYYPTLLDATNDTNQITNPTNFENRTKPTDSVWARANSTFGCFRVSEIELIVSVTAIPSTFVKTFNECDDFLDTDGNDTDKNDDTDGITNFDFSSTTQDVLTILGTTESVVTISYYRNEIDALAELNAIADPSNYRNIGYQNTQTIFIRVDSKLDNDCLGFGPYIKLEVDDVPNPTAPLNIELCDDDSDGDSVNGLSQFFDLESQTSSILNGINPTNHEVTYHTSQEDANSGNLPLTSPFSNTVANSQTIYVRVENTTTGCFNDHITFDVVVNELPKVNNAANIVICDNDFDGSASNGIVQNIDLNSQTSTILGTQDPAIFIVTYHNSRTEADNGQNALSSPYTNNTPSKETIYVRIFNQNTGCAQSTSTFDIIINPEPIANIIENISYCDDDSDGDDTNGFVQNIDLQSHITSILGVTQSESDFEVTFHNNNTDAVNGANSISNLYANKIAYNEEVFVRVRNRTTECVNVNTSFNIIINRLPYFEIATPQIVCLNGPNLTLDVEIPTHDYTYQWTAPDGTTSNQRTITITSGGVYSITATTTNGTNCSRTKTVQVNESIIATIDLNDITVIDDSDNNSITIDNSFDNLGIGDYEFALENSNGSIVFDFQIEPYFENLTGGIYTILVRDKNGCGLVKQSVPVVVFPKFFTPNNDGINDTWGVKGVNSTFFPKSAIYIFDRYGKAITELPIDNRGWDGTINGKILPSNDYWFSIMLVDNNGKARNRKGHFSLLRK